MRKTLLIVFLVLISLYFLPVESMFIFLTAILGFGSVLNGGRVRVSLFPGSGIYIWFLLTGTVVGIYHILFHSYVEKYVLKDMVYVLFVLMFWLLGKNIGIQRQTGISSLFIAGTVVSFYDLIHALYQVFCGQVTEISLYHFRRMIGAGHPLTLVTLFLYIFIPEEILLKKRVAYSCMCILLADMLIHFSRMTLLSVCVFLMYLRFSEYPVKIVRYACLIIIGSVVVYGAFPSVFDDYINRLGNSMTEISYDQEPWEHADIVTNWRGYEAYCELQKFKSAGIMEKIFGGGFGTQLDVGGKAYLVTTEETLPFLHNGYFSILMIWGIIGSAAYILLLCILYLKGRALAGGVQRMWKALVVMTAFDTLFVHGPFFSTGVAGLFLYLGVLEE